MTTTEIQQQLSTPEGFAKAVSPRRTAYGVAITALVLSAAGIALNLFQLGTASDWRWNLMFRYFFDAQAVQFTGSGAGRSEVWRFLYVWGPVVLIPVAVVLLVVHFSTRRKSAAALYADFRARGWVARQLLPGLQVRNGNKDVAIALISHPSIPEQEFEQAVQGYAAYLGTLDKKALKAVSTAALKAKVLKGVSASALAPQLHPAILAAPVEGKGAYVVVVPPDAAGNGTLQVRPISL